MFQDFYCQYLSYCWGWVVKGEQCRGNIVNDQACFSAWQRGLGIDGYGAVDIAADFLQLRHLAHIGRELNKINEADTVVGQRALHTRYQIRTQYGHVV